jgi:hypothetical protein
MTKKNGGSVINNKQFLIDDIKAMMPTDTQDLLNAMTQESLYRLWLDLVNLNRTKELEQ